MNRLAERRTRFFLIGALALYAAFLFSLCGDGAIFFPDEGRFRSSFFFLRTITNLDFRGALLNLFQGSARPGETLIRGLPAAAQLLLERWKGVPAVSPRSLVIPQLFNAGIVFLKTLVFYKLSEGFLNDPKSRLVSTAVYALLANSFVYVRHVLPYDIALLFVLAAFVLSSRAVLSAVLYAGALLVYPGYYFLTPVFFALGWVKIGKRVFFGIAALGAVFALTELLSRGVGQSYFLQLRSLSGTVIEGSFDEGFAFLPKYAWQVEGLIGVVLIALSLMGVSIAVARVRSFQERAFVVLALGIAATWVYQASLSAFLQSMVFYGRLLHGYFPFLVLISVGALERCVLTERARSAALAGVLLASSASFTLGASSASKYYAIEYPRNALHRLGLEVGFALPPRAAFVDRFCPLNTPGTSPYVPRDEKETEIDFVLVNFCFYQEDVYRPSERAAAAMIPANLVFSGPQAFSFPAYGFEGDSSEVRAGFRDPRFVLAVYRIPH